MDPRPLLIPSLLDDHFPLLRRALASERWEPVLLEAGPGLADRGLRYLHSELCYPAILVAGQVLSALDSGRYDPARCGVLIGQAGDECRGSCLIRLLRRALDRAGYAQVALVSLNVRGIDREDGLPLRPAMVGDALALLRDQTRPFEAVPGAAEALWQTWVDRLSAEEAPAPAAAVERCREMAASFRALETVERRVEKVAVVGELYTKNCRLGNWDLKQYLAAEHCRVAVGGLTWQALYYMDSHALKGPAAQRALYRAAGRWAAGIQRDMVAVLRKAGFETLPPFDQLKREAAPYAPLNVTVADGWLIAAEAAAWAKLGYRKILCVQPFACLPGHVFGKGQYAALQRKLPQARLVSVDYDASTGEGTVLSRVRMLLDEVLP
ncbi:hypothetical protein [uncultured Oscillibacter sp.]|uniref:hypothetical protein n=1 Tax=uncultured Oscillibacter sp. TaxID=876091 RepID=UPI002805F70F|nr:hypothetical protein [uncultured Oscillibacter sp.]